MNKRHRDKIIEKYLPYVEKIIQDYKNCALEYFELLSIGNYALVEIADKYDKIGSNDLNKTIEFYIRKSIIKEMLVNMITCSIPESEFEKIIVNVDSIELYSKIENGQIDFDEKYDNENSEYSELIFFLFFPLISLDGICIENRNTYEKTLINFWGEYFQEPEIDTKRTYLRNDINIILMTLTPREEKVIRLRFGIDDNYRRTLEEIGIIFKKSRERIRQIEVTALRKLRQQTGKQILMNSLEKTYIERIFYCFGHSETNIINDIIINSDGNFLFNISHYFHQYCVYTKYLQECYFQKDDSSQYDYTINKVQFDFNYLELAKLYKIEVRDEYKYLFQQLQKKEGSISSIRLDSLSRIKKINFNTIIFNLNSHFREIFKRNFLTFENEIWEVNPFFNHPGNWEFKSIIDDETIDKKRLEKNSLEEYPKWLLDQTEKLKDIFKHTVTTYKFYWFKALLTLVERGKKEASFKQMAAIMCAHAWKDVLIKNCTFPTIDQIPGIVRRIYLDSQLQSTENENTIIDYLYDNLDKYEELLSKLVIMVPYRFLSIFFNDLKSLKDYQKNDYIESESRKTNLLYKIRNNKIHINTDWNKFLLNNFDDLKKLSPDFKNCEE